jgi:hypothetical protein
MRRQIMSKGNSSKYKLRTHKFCNKCSRDLPIIKFNKDKNKKDGLNGWCVDCKQTARFKNCEIPEVYLKRRWDNFLKDRRKDRDITYEEVLDLFNQHCEENIAEGKHKYACAYTGEVMTFTQGRGRRDSNLSVDRMDNDKPYTKENITFCTTAFNRKKGEVTLELVKKILNVFKKKGIH